VDLIHRPQDKGQLLAVADTEAMLCFPETEEYASFQSVGTSCG
jgi:hypothetical protein